MKCLYNGKLIIKGRLYEKKAILFDEKIIDIINEEEIHHISNLEKIDARGCYISPGFMDIHIHGYDGFDTMDATEEALETISRGIAGNGVTSFLPTTMSMPKENIIQALNTIRKIREKGTSGAEILGAHVEGPFINKKFHGAQKKEYIIPFDCDIINDYKDVISLMTIAPELEGALDFIKEVKRKSNIVLSMGHSAATFEEALEGIAYGICHVTHLFNAMSGLHHRNPGVVGAALTTNVSCEIIADEIHIHPDLFSVILKAKGLDGIVLVTDCMSAGGKEDGVYELGGQKVFVKDKEARLEDNTLAGSVLKLNHAIYNLYKRTNYSIPQLVQLVSINPARVLGLEFVKGTLDIGKDADITVFDEKINILMTIGKGKIIYAI